MGSHMWYDQCPYCGFDEMVVQSDGLACLEAACPMCGYEIRPGWRIPAGGELERVRRALDRMSTSDKAGIVESWWDDRVPFVDRLKA